MSGKYIVEYEAMIAHISAMGCDDPFRKLFEAFEAEWLPFYKQMSPRVTKISAYLINQFEYVYDDYASLEQTGSAPFREFIVSRFVYVHGRSQPPASKRNTSRQKGWVGHTEKHLGADTDTGHFIVHSMGGGLEINVFAKIRAINRGWSFRGSLYQKDGETLRRKPRHLEGVSYFL